MVSFVQYCLVLLLTIASSYCGPAGLARRSPSEGMHLHSPSIFRCLAHWTNVPHGSFLTLSAGNPSADDVSHQFKYWSPKKTPYERRPYWFIGNRQDWVVAQNQARIQAALMNTPYSARVKYRDWMACMNRRVSATILFYPTGAPSFPTHHVVKEADFDAAARHDYCSRVSGRTRPSGRCSRRR